MEKTWEKKGKEAIQSGSANPSTAYSIAANPSKREGKERTLPYDVFLSFRISPLKFSRLLRKGLEDVGFRVFVDINIDPGLEFIADSRLSIPILSEHYARERRCLDQVAKIYDCWSTKGQIVLPIFYDVEPSDFQTERGNFWDSFHGSRWINRDIKWEKALKEIGTFEGHHVTGVELEVVSRIVSHITQLLKADEVRGVALERPMQMVVEMFQTSSPKIVGICGLPGIGKTTLAKALYHKLLPEFQHHCFITNIQERSERGLNFLQNQLIGELLQINYDNIRSVEDNLNFISDELACKTVLIVLDDVECLDHIKAFGVGLVYFGFGSKIILTTQKPKLLAKAKAYDRYFVEGLDELLSLKLFCSYAFGKDSPEGEYIHLSAEIASSSRGIPRVIEAVGSYLSKYKNKEKERWEEVLQQLKSCQYKTLQESLMQSHDDLSRGRWHFYHDKECFPIGGSSDINHYDVVLSFDARDRVKNLVESLHRRMASVGIGIFALNGDCSIRVNDSGKIFIPIFSKSFASNLSCLEMLAHMEDCRRSSATNHILPIFYAIEPSSGDRLQTPLYEGCSSWSLPESFTAEEFHNLINSICQTALDKLKLNQTMENHLVGIDEHVEN